ETVKVAAQSAKSDKPAVETKPAATQGTATATAVKVLTTYKELTALGSDGVRALAKHHGVADVKHFRKLCGAVWAKIRPAAAPTADKPAAAKSNDKPADATAKVTAYAAGTVVVSDGKGGFAVATEAQLWAALEALTRKVA